MSVQTDLNDNWDKIDTVAGNVICTEVTKPSGGSRFTGQQIFCTDSTIWYMWDGSAWQILSMINDQTYVPGLSGATQGNGTLDGQYHKAGRHVWGQARLIFGSTTSVSGTIIMGIPFASLNTLRGHVGSGLALDASGGTAAFRGVEAELASTTGVNFIISGAGGLVNATAPFTWAVGDELRFAFSYEAAS